MSRDQTVQSKTAANADAAKPPTFPHRRQSKDPGARANKRGGGHGAQSLTLKSSVIAAAITASALCVTLACSAGFANTSVAQWLWCGGPLFALDLACAWALAFALTFALLRVGAPQQGRHAARSHHRRLDKDASEHPSILCRLLPATWDLRGIAHSAVLIYIAWIPVLLFVWPGIATPDTVNMLYQFASPAPTWYGTVHQVVDAEFVNHHPVLDSLICGAFWELGGLTGDHTWGIFLFALANYAFAAALLGALVCYSSSKLDAPRLFAIAAQAFFMFFPIFPLFFAYLSKDAIFVPWFVLWTLLFALRWNSPEGRCPGRWLVLYIVASVLCILTKQLALYVIVPSAIVLSCRVHGVRARAGVLLGTAASLVFALAVFPATVYPLVGGVAPGGKQEVLGTPLNQTVTLFQNDPSAFSKKELRTLSAVIDLERVEKDWGRLDPFRVDRVKDKFRPDATNAEIVAFLKLWAKKGLQHPGSYAATCYGICMPFFMPTQGAEIIGFPNQELLSHRQKNVEAVGLSWTDLDLHQPETFRANQEQVRESLATATGLPALGIFFTFGLYSGWMPLICFLALALRRPRALGALVPIGMFWLLQLIEPAALTRYAMPIIALAPFMIAWTACLLRSKPRARTIDVPAFPLDGSPQETGAR